MELIIHTDKIENDENGMVSYKHNKYEGFFKNDLILEHIIANKKDNTFHIKNTQELYKQLIK